MRRDPRAYLWDIEQGCVNVQSFLSGISLAEYQSNLLLRSAIERQLQNIGEALAQLAKLDPELAARVPDYRQLIGFRNVLVHGYATLNHDEVWRAIAESLPPLHSTANALLAGLGAEDPS